MWKSGSPTELAQVDPTASRSFAVYTHRRRRKRPAAAKPKVQRAKTNLPKLTKAQAVADFQRHVVPEIWVTHGRENLETLGYAWRRYVGNMVRAGRLPPGAVDWTVPTRRRR